jgi:hypothetical protein
MDEELISSPGRSPLRRPVYLTFAGITVKTALEGSAPIFLDRG